MNKRLFGPRSRPGAAGSGHWSGTGDDNQDAGPAPWPGSPGVPLEPGSEAARQIARAELARCMSNPELRRMIARMRLPDESEAAPAGRDDRPAAAPPPPPEVAPPPVSDTERAAAAATHAAIPPDSDAELPPPSPATRRVPVPAGPEPFRAMTAAYQRGRPAARTPDRPAPAKAEPPEAVAPATTIIVEPQAQRHEPTPRWEHRRRRRLSRRGRVVIGLTPVYLGLLVFAYDAVFGPYQPARQTPQAAMTVAREVASDEPVTVGGYALAIDTRRSLPDIADTAPTVPAGLPRTSASIPPAARIDTRIGLATAPGPVMAVAAEAGGRPANAGAAAALPDGIAATAGAGQAEGGVFAQQAGATVEDAGPILAALDPAAGEGLTLEPAEAEEALALDRTTRREIQRRLSLAGFGTGGVDGIFGDRTRAAIAEWQQERGISGTGYLDAAQLATLKDETDADYRRYRSTHREERAQPRPAARARSEVTGRYIDASGCLREPDGSAVPYFRAGCG